MATPWPRSTSRPLSLRISLHIRDIHCFLQPTWQLSFTPVILSDRHNVLGRSILVECPNPKKCIVCFGCCRHFGMRNPQIVVIALCLVFRRRLRGVTGSHHSPRRETTPGAEGTAIGSDWPQLLRIQHASVEGGHQSWNTLGPGIIFFRVPRTLWDGPKSLNTANIQSSMISMSPKLDILVI